MKRMTDAQRFALRTAIIAGPTDCPMTPEEASVFLGRSEAYLRASDFPRAVIASRPLYMKSELLKGVRAKLSHRILDPTG
jgi:hypothetical protein